MFHSRIAETPFLLCMVNAEMVISVLNFCIRFIITTKVYNFYFLLLFFNTSWIWYVEGYLGEDGPSVQFFVQQVWESGKNTSDLHSHSLMPRSCWTPRSSWGLRKLWWVCAWRRINSPPRQPDGLCRSDLNHAFCRTGSHSQLRMCNWLLANSPPKPPCLYRGHSTADRRAAHCQAHP